MADTVGRVVRINPSSVGRRESRNVIVATWPAVPRWRDPSGRYGSGIPQS